MSDKNPEFPYRMRQDYLSPAESAFFHVLTGLVKGQYFVCPKVALTDLFFVARPNENVQFGSKLLRRNVDFLLLWPEGLKPALAIELDYPKQTDHRPVDHFLDGLFASTGVPLIHVTARPPYDIKLLAERFRDALINSYDTTPDRADFSPLCPRCGSTMVLRFDKNGPVKGQKYYGCLNFPTCLETVALRQ
ncbi:MAG: DUF2726 domain-containing protein [Chloroflexi bacterium]|nr:DUF2726 domain-containing protein [Chloroflexota bacterium]